MQDQMRACPHCGAQTSANAQFCKTCGKSVAAEPTNMPREATAPIERKCSACGEALSETAQFCETCGKSVAPIAQPANTIPKAAPAVSADRPAAPVVAPTTHASRSTNLGLFVSLAIVGVLIIIGCLAVAVLGFWFMQSKPTVTSQLPAGTPQLVVVPTYIVPTNIAPTNVPTSPAATIRPPTSAPLATNTPSLPVGVLFLDDFASQDVSKRNGWYFGSDDTVDEKWSANQLLISIKTKNRSAVNLTAGQYQDFAVETEAQLIEGDSASYGLVFRSTESGGKATYYYFNVTADGGYSVWRFVNGNSIEPALIPIQTSQFINHGKAKNIVGVMAKGNTLSFYINRVRVQTVTDDTIQSKGQVGVEVAGFSEHATVAFSRFTVYTPDKAQAEWCPPPTTALPVGVLFNEDFSSARVAACNGWWEILRSDYDALWSPNAFTLSIKKPNYGAIDTMDGQYADFALETEAQPLDENVNVYGLIFRFNQDQNGKLNYYRFALVPDGRYALGKLVAGEWQTRVVDYTASPLIKTGKNKNILGVIAQGNTFSLYINRALVKTVTDDAIKGSGLVGVTIGNGTSAPAATSFSRVMILTPDKARADWGDAPPVVSSAPTVALQPTAVIAPGLYVSALRLDPGPKRGVDIAFYPTFLNTTGGAQSTRVKVYLYRAENPRNSFGETSIGPITIPVGSTEQRAAGSWKLSGGGCEDFIARVGSIDDQNRITYFNAPAGGVIELRLSMCQ